MSQGDVNRQTRRRTHSEPIVVRFFDDVDEYWLEATERRRYSIPHSDGSFFSDGSGYSNGPVHDLQFEVAERLKEVVERLRGIDISSLNEFGSQQNSNFLPHADEIEAAIRESERGIEYLLGTEPPNPNTLDELHGNFARLASTFISRGVGLCGAFLENSAADAGREFGKTVGKFGGIALVLYLSGVDFHAVALAIGELITKTQ